LGDALQLSKRERVLHNSETAPNSVGRILSHFSRWGVSFLNSPGTFICNRFGKAQFGIKGALFIQMI
jgi:hypothetical protein